MIKRRNWLEPAVRVYLVCAVGALVVGSFLGTTWLKLIGGFLLGMALLAIPIVGAYLFFIGRAKPLSRPESQTAAGQTPERGRLPRPR